MGTPPVTPAPYSIGPAEPPQPGWWSRNWKWFVPLGCLTLLVAFAAFAGSIVFFVFGVMKNSEVAQLALQKARANQTVQQRLGTPIEIGTLVSGSINEAGTSGKADITIPLKGPKGEGTLYVDATKFANEWKFNRLEAELPGEPNRVDLLPPVVQDQ
jgi:hypothetical protein